MRSAFSSDVSSLMGSTGIVSSRVSCVGNGGEESECGWCKDRWGISWQITPRTLMDAMAAGGGEAKRAFDAMMTMKKIDVAKIDAARRG